MQGGGGGVNGNLSKVFLPGYLKTQLHKIKTFY